MTKIFMNTGGAEFMQRGKSTGRAIVGETNDEQVTRFGLRTGKTETFNANRMMSINNLGLHEPEFLNVIPTKGYYAQRYKERMNLGAMIEPGHNMKVISNAIGGMLGGVGKSIAKFFATGGSSYTVPPVVMTSDTGRRTRWIPNGEKGYK